MSARAAAAAPRARAVLAAAGAVLAASLAASCASAPGRDAPSVAPRPIDASPACLAELAPQLPALGERAAEARTAPRTATLANGARLVEVEAPASALATIAAGFPVDWAHTDVPSDLATGLLASGATAGDADAFVDAVRALGAHVGASADDGWLWLELRFPEARADGALDVLARWLRVSPPADEPLARARRRAALARLADDATASAVATRAFARLHAPVAGAARAVPRPDLDGATPDALARFLANALDPARAVFVYERARSDDAVRARLAALRGAPSDGAKHSAQVEPAGAAAIANAANAIHVVDRPGAAQVELLVGHATVGPADADFAALSMLASLLGGDVGGRLFRDLRERQGLAYVANAEQRRDGTFVVTTRTRPERLAALLVGVEAHLAALASTPLAGCERAMLARRALGEIALAGDAPASRRTRERAELAAHGRVRDDAERAADVRRALARLDDVARHHLAGAPLVVLVGDRARIERELAAVIPERPIAEVDPFAQAGAR